MGELIYQFIWIFFVYAFLGWCGEVAFAVLKTGKFVNRGFLNGPLCPIYGFGVVIVLLCLTPLKENIALLFVGSVILTSVLEWITGFLLEKFFHERWWDYSEEPFNISGYVCLRFSILWGFACIFVVDILHPSIEFLISVIPRPVGIALLAILGGYLAVDLAATVATITKMNRRLKQIDALAAQLKTVSDEFGEEFSAHVLKAADRGADLKETLYSWKEEVDANLHARLQEGYEKLREQLQKDIRGQRRLVKAFPRLSAVHHPDLANRHKK